MRDPRIERVADCLREAMLTPSRDETLVGIFMERLIHTKPEAFDGWGDFEVVAVLCMFMQRCPEAQLDEMLEVANNADTLLVEYEALRAQHAERTAARQRLQLV